MNLLELVQSFAGRTGVPVPSYVFGNTDQQIVQILELLKEELEDQIERPWQALIREAVFTSQAGEDQGAVATLAPEGFRWILQETIFDRSEQQRILGPSSARDWQAMKAGQPPGVLRTYRIVGGRLLVAPAMPAGHTCAFEYSSSHIVVDTTGTTKPYPTVESDAFLIDSDILLAGLRCRWKYEKGLDYAEDLRRYDVKLTKALGRDGTKPTLHLGCPPDSSRPGILVPPGYWNLP